MTSAAIVFRPNLKDFAVVSTYYGQSRRENTPQGFLAVDRVATFDGSYKNLVERLLAEQRSHVVIVSHANAEYGLNLPIASTTDVSIQDELPRLVALVDELSAAQGQFRESAKWKECAQRWKMSDASVKSLATSCYKIRTHPHACASVHIRGCNVGRNGTYLMNQRLLFNSNTVTAPTCQMFYITVRPYYGKTIDTFVKTNPVKGRRFIYPASDGYPKQGRGPFLLDINYGHPPDTQANVERYEDIRAWADFKHGRSTGVTNAMTLAGLWPSSGTGYWLADEGGFRGLLAESKS